MKKYIKVGEVMALTKLSKRQIGLWERNGLIKLRRCRNSVLGTMDRCFSEDDMKRIFWIKKMNMNKRVDGLSMDAIRLVIEYYTKGKISSVKWYK